MFPLFKIYSVCLIYPVVMAACDKTLKWHIRDGVCIGLLRDVDWVCQVARILADYANIIQAYQPESASQA